MSFCYIINGGSIQFPQSNAASYSSTFLLHCLLINQELVDSFIPFTNYVKVNSTWT